MPRCTPQPRSCDSRLFFLFQYNENCARPSVVKSKSQLCHVKLHFASVETSMDAYRRGTMHKLMNHHVLIIHAKPISPRIQSETKEFIANGALASKDKSHTLRRGILANRRRMVARLGRRARSHSRGARSHGRRARSHGRRERSLRKSGLKRSREWSPFNIIAVDEINP